MSSPIIAVVTGANRGIGHAICQTLAADFQEPLVLYATSRKGDDLGFKSSSTKTQIKYPSLDIANSNSVNELANTIKKDHDGLDVLINNAGVNLDDQYSPENVKTTLDINYRGTLKMCQTFTPLLRSNGRIVNVSSTASSLRNYNDSIRARFRNSSMTLEDLENMMNEYQECARQGTEGQNGWPTQSYSVSKAAMNALTAVLARENQGLIINSCCPGWVAMDMGKMINSKPPKNPAEGARIPIRLGFGDIQGVTGRYWGNNSISGKGFGEVQEWSMASPMRAIWQATNQSNQLKSDISEQAEAPSTSHSPEPPPPASTTTVSSQLDEKATPARGAQRYRRSQTPRRSKSKKSTPRRSPTLVGSDDPIDTTLPPDSDAQQKLLPLNDSSNMFPSFLDANSSTSGPNSSMQRPAPMASQQQQHQVNGTGSSMNGIGGGISNGSGGLPMNAGQQMDVNMLYQKVIELSDVLRENRERTQAIVAGAEELATRAAANGANPSLQEADAEISGKTWPWNVEYVAFINAFSGSRIADLERQLAREQNKTRTMLREQKENTKLIGEYETAVGHIVETVRNYSFNNKAEKTALQLHYNKLLQEEKDAHLEARLEKDHWHSKFMRSVEMLREAYRLRCEEEEVPTRVVAGLQNEVRAYRSALGMEKERPEDEFGWEILKDVVDRGDDQ